MFEWISNNLKLVVSGILVVISVVVFILRKPSKVSLIDNSGTSQLLDLVNEAEEKYGNGHGEEKLQYVVTKYLNRNGIHFDAAYWAIVSEIVEKILSTPSKK